MPVAVTELATRIKEDYYTQNDVDQATRDQWEQRDLRPLPDWTPRFRPTLLEAELHDDSRGERVYAARPLTGIWATAPFLHNGSVPTLYHLLLPADERPATFPVGQREYDVTRLGYQIDPSELSAASDRPAASFVLDTTLSGNSNAGHEYGTDLDDAARTDLLEFMKVVGEASP